MLPITLDMHQAELVLVVYSGWVLIWAAVWWCWRRVRGI
jgi:hypothetical protein